MRISDWSSDVCSSDLHVEGGTAELPGVQRRDEVVLHQVLAAPGIDEAGSPGELREQAPVQDAGGLGRQRQQADKDLDLRQQRGEDVRPAVAEIGRATCRERVCQYAYISVVAVSLIKTI